MATILSEKSCLPGAGAMAWFIAAQPKGKAPVAEWRRSLHALKAGCADQ
jgi:hypothetical protein